MSNTSIPDDPLQQDPNTLELRRKLPDSLAKWRQPGGIEDEAALWEGLHGFFATHGITLWPSNPNYTPALRPPAGTTPLSSGFAYVSPVRREAKIGGIDFIWRFEYPNPVNYAARTREGHDVVIRVLTIGEHGRPQLDILRKIAMAPLSLFSDNHTLPLLREIRLDDITFGVFPYCGEWLGHLYGVWPKNSAGDVINIIMQALEALVFIHERGIAHRDAYKHNFLLQWHPESHTAKSVAVSRPRVYLIDFEVAVEFPPECPPEQRRCVGLPSGGTILPGKYMPTVPSEVPDGVPYDPFKLDVWQLGWSCRDFQTTIPEIDAVLLGMWATGFAYPFDAATTLKMLADIVNTLPPRALNVKPRVESLIPGTQPEFPAPRKRRNSC